MTEADVREALVCTPLVEGPAEAEHQPRDGRESHRDDGPKLSASHASLNISLNCSQIFLKRLAAVAFWLSANMPSNIIMVFTTLLSRTKPP